jgi:hypothetical protein
MQYYLFFNNSFPINQEYAIVYRFKILKSIFQAKLLGNIRCLTTKLLKHKLFLFSYQMFNCKNKESRGAALFFGLIKTKF